MDTKNRFDTKLLAMPFKMPSKKSNYRRPPKGGYLRGPVPIVWLHKASRLRGKALAVGIALWFKRGVTKSPTVKASGSLWEKFGIERRSAYRGLESLEQAGLITVIRGQGQVPIVTIMSDPDKILKHDFNQTQDGDTG